MQTTMAVEDITVSLPELIAKLSPGDEIILTLNDKRVAKLIGEEPKPVKLLRPGPGLGKGMIAVVGDDGDHLKDFAEYMP